MAEQSGSGDPGLIDRWQSLQHELSASGARLLAVSKYASEEAVDRLVAAGQMDFGESRPQQLRDRALRHPSVRWHMIGPLQKNKAKYIARHAAAWHSLEDLETARAVAGLVEGRRLPVLVQVNVAGIAHQHGVHPDALPDLLAGLAELPSLLPAGVMCMAPQQGDVRASFATLRGLRDRLFDGSLAGVDWLAYHPVLCMGMSGDFRMAVEEGSDIVRIGSLLFDD